MTTDLLTLGSLDDAALTKFARLIPDPAEYKLGPLFAPEISIDSIKYRVTTDSRTINAAKFRTYDAETPIGRRTASREVLDGILPPVGVKTSIGELETILEYMARGADEYQLIQQIYDDATNNVLSIRARMELARGDLLTDGKFTLSQENGLTLEADFSLKSTHTTAPTVAWNSTTTTPTPLDDEIGWRDTIADDGGAPPDTVITSQKVARWLLKSEDYRNAFYGRDADGTPTLTPAQLQSVRDQWGLPPITTYDGQVSVDGTLKRVLKDTQFCTYNRAGMAQTQYGLTAEALTLSSGSNPSIERRDAPGIVVTRRVTDDPVAVWVRATANAMPILFKPEGLISVDVG